MRKETIICLIIIIAIVGLDIMTQKYTKETTKQITTTMESLKGEILAEDKEKIEERTKELDKNWTEKHDKLAYYIEHDELEKVDTAIINMKSYIETKEYSSAVANLDEGKFILEHIEDKNAFNLVNIF